MILKDQNNLEEFAPETHFCSLLQVTAVDTRSCRWCRGIKNWCSWQRKTSQLWGAARKGSHEKLRTIWNVAWSETWTGVRVNEQEGKSSGSLWIIRESSILGWSMPYIFMLNVSLRSACVLCNIAFKTILHCKRKHFIFIRRIFELFYFLLLLKSTNI